MSPAGVRQDRAPWQDRARRERRQVAAVAVLASLNALVWAWMLPFNNGHDEDQHYAVAAFIAEHGRWPVFGPGADLWAYLVDDLYRSSYATYPGLSYLASGLAMRLLTLADPSLALLGARLPSVLGVGVAVWLAGRLAALLLPRTSRVRLALPLCVATLPELTFVGGYTNTDAYTVAATAGLLLAALHGAARGWTHATPLALGLSAGLVLLGKYNGYLYLPVGLAVAALTAPSWRIRWRALGVASATAALAAGWWFVRSTRLYGDPLGFGAQAAAVRAVLPDYRSPGLLGYDPLSLLLGSPWVAMTLATFLGGYPYYEQWLPGGLYAVWLLLVVGLTGALLWWGGRRAVEVARGGRAVQRWRVVAGGALGALVLGGIGQSVGNTLVFDYQPQGRYLLPMAIPLLLLWLRAWEVALARFPWLQRGVLYGLPAFFAVAGATWLWGVILPMWANGARPAAAF